MAARIEIIQRLEIFEITTVIQKENDIFHTINNDSKQKLAYTKKPNYDFPRSSYTHFPIILNKDGGLWGHANRFLLCKLKAIKRPSYKTLEATSIDLQNFRRWLDQENIDYLKFIKRVFARPTYRYCAYLHDEVNNQNIGFNTAKRRMNNIQNFYRWLVQDGVKFDYPLWQEKDAYISFKDDQGFIGSKKVKTTDLGSSIKVPKHHNDYSNLLSDGGKLRPLIKEEQKATIEALNNISNPEMTLAFIMALTTGARLQTVFTLRRCHFEKFYPEIQSVISLKVGIGTLVDTKYNKSLVLLIPHWLYRRVQIYINSERSKRRFQRSNYIYEPINQQYAFLTHAGLPYYISNQDPFIEQFKIPPKGNAITQFILQQLKPELKRLGNPFSLRYHDLRATFGMNLLEEKLSSLDNSADLFKVLMHVRDRMGHSNIRTTENYLNYRKNYHHAVSTQSEFEKYIMQQTEDLVADDLD